MGGAYYDMLPIHDSGKNCTLSRSVHLFDSRPNHWGVPVGVVWPGAIPPTSVYMIVWSGDIQYSKLYNLAEILLNFKSAKVH